MQVLDDGILLNNCMLYFKTKQEANFSNFFERESFSPSGVVELGEKFPSNWYGGRLNDLIFIYADDTESFYEGSSIGPFEGFQVKAFKYTTVVGATKKIRAFIPENAHDLYR